MRGGERGSGGKPATRARRFIFGALLLILGVAVAWVASRGAGADSDEAVVDIVMIVTLCVFLFLGGAYFRRPERYTAERRKEKRTLPKRDDAGGK